MDIMYDQIVEQYLSSLIDKPDLIWYRENGSIRYKYWCKDGKWHREGDKPFLIYYREDGSIESERWYKDGKYVQSSS